MNILASMLRQLESQSPWDELAEEYVESCQIWKMVLFAEIVNGFQSLIIFAKSSTILDV